METRERTELWLVGEEGFGWLVFNDSTKAIVSRLHEAENEDTDQSGTLPYSYDRRDLSGSLSCPE